MQKTLLFLALLAFTTILHAQTNTFKAFKVDLGVGYAIPTASSGDGVKAGVTLTVHPHYRLTDDLAVGVRFETAALGYENLSGGNSDVKVSVLSSYCATGEYYLSDNGLRPFVGAGLGVFAQSAVEVTDGGANQLMAASTKFGFFPEVGIEAGHFRLSADYNIVGNNNNYLAIKIGGFFGGGRK